MVAFGAGLAFGGSGRFAAAERARRLAARLDVAEARGQLLDARVSLYNVNFGDASRHFEEARRRCGGCASATRTWARMPPPEASRRAIEHVDEAQRLAAKLDQAANAKANEALEAIQRRGVAVDAISASRPSLRPVTFRSDAGSADCVIDHRLAILENRAELFHQAAGRRVFRRAAIRRRASRGVLEADLHPDGAVAENLRPRVDVR